MSRIPRPQSPPATPPATSTPPDEYGKWQAAGAIRQRWIEDATDTTCPVQPTTLTVADLRSTGYFVQTNKSSVPYVITDDATALGYAPGRHHTRFLARKDATSTPDRDPNVFDMVVGNGVVVAEAIFRKDGPQFSQVAMAMMREVADPRSLRHLYVTDIINGDTKDFIEEMLYTPRNGLDRPPATQAPRVWHYNTAQYQGLLGTRIGKCAAYLVLEIFPRGTHYIARISTWEQAYSLQMRFDIEPIPAPSASV
jgi:hypothetical protein